MIKHKSGDVGGRRVEEEGVKGDLGGGAGDYEETQKGALTLFRGSALGHLGWRQIGCPCLRALVTDSYPCSNHSTLLVRFAGRLLIKTTN